MEHELKTTFRCRCTALSTGAYCAFCYTARPTEVRTVIKAAPMIKYKRTIREVKHEEVNGVVEM